MECVCGFSNAPGAVECAKCRRTLLALRPVNEIVMRNPPSPRRGPPPMPPPRWRAVLSKIPTEQTFLVALRANPNDRETRAVYADWLEQQGDSQRATFVRHEGRLTDRAQVLGTDDAEWRAVVARTNVECGRSNCWGRWDTFEAHPLDEQLRKCPNCTLTVRYCANRAEVEAVGWTEAPYVIDADLDPEEASSWHDQAALTSARSRTW